MTARREAGPESGRSPADDHPEARASHGGSDAHRRAVLSTAIEQSIIPRLLRAQLAGTETEAPDLAHLTGRPISSADILEMGRLVLLPDDTPARAAILALQIRGVAREVLYTDLLTPTARLLGEWWEEDLCTFVDVTVGVGRLQQALRDLSAGLAVSPADGEPVRRVLLTPTPTEQHTFGLLMVSEFFRSAGWDVSGGPHPQLDPVAHARRDWFDVVAFSLASELLLDTLKSTITAVRKASLNGQVGILVGGPMFVRDPGLAREVGADAVAVDGSLAPEIASKLVKTRALVS